MGKILTLWLLWAILPLPVIAQVYSSKVYAVRNGLPSDHINDVAQDSRKLLWVSTSDGIASYDGISWQVVEESSMPVYVDTRIKTLPNGNIFVAGTNNESIYTAFYFDSEKWHNIELPRSDVYDIGRFWDVALIDSTVIIKLILRDTLYTGRVGSSVWTKNKIPAAVNYNQIKIWISGDITYLASNGIYFEDNTGITQMPIMNFEDKQLTDVWIENDSLWWVLGTNFLGKIKNGRFEALPLTVSEKQPFRQLRKGQPDIFFFRSAQNFYWYSLRTRKAKRIEFDNFDILARNSRMFVDHENSMWLTSYRGLHQIQSFQFTSLTKKNGLPDDEVSLIIELAPNRYLLGGNKFYSILDNGNILINKASDTTINNTRLINYVKARINNRDRIFIAGENAGVGELLSDNSIHWYRGGSQGIVNTTFFYDTLWAIDATGVMYAMLQNKLVRKHHLYAYTRNVYTLQSGEILFCHRHEVKIYNGKTWRIISTPNVMLRQVYCAFEEDGEIYLGTEGGLAKIENDQIVPATFRGFSITNQIYAVVHVSPEELWLGTNNGVLRVTNNQLDRFNESNGMVGSEINRGALLHDSQGNILIGTNRGLNFYNPLFDYRRTTSLQPEIIQLKRGEDSYEHPWTKLQFKPANENITISFRAITFKNSPVTFRYRMIGFENEWQFLESVDQRQVIYRNLPFGEFQFELQSKRADGSTWSTSVISAPIIMERPFYLEWWFYAGLLLLSGVVGYFINTVINQLSQTRRLRALVDAKIKEVQENEAKLQLALENSKTGVWTYNFGTQKTEYTPNLFEILDTARGKTLSYNQFLERTHPDTIDKVKTGLRQAVETKTPYDIETLYKLRDGSYRWLHGKGQCVYDEHGKPHVISGTLHDITKRKQYEAEREKLIHDLEIANQELDRFAYSTSHDLSAPLKSVLGLLNLIKQNPTPEERQQYLELIERSIKKQDEFIKEIVQYSRNARTEVVTEPIEIRKMIDEVVESLRFTDHFSTAQVSIDIENGLEKIETDSSRLKIILNNLLSNALKFKKKFPGEQHQVNVRVFTNGNRFSLQVQDNGMGIDDQHMQNIFKMFYRATDHQPGSGLGLYIAHEAARKIGYMIEVESVLGEGSTFTVKPAA